MPESTITLYLRDAFDPRDTFDPSIEGVDPITTTGTPVPAGQVKAVKSAARRYGQRVTR
jgi:hypothetical protein